MPMKCTQCGIDLSDFDLTCPACGAVKPRPAAAAEPSDPAAEPSGFEVYSAPPEPPPTLSFGSWGMWVLLLLAFIAAGGVYEATQRMTADTNTAEQSGDDAARIATLQRNEGECETALGSLQQATFAMNRLDFHSAMNFANEGLTHNANCTESSHLAFGGVLLSIKAVSEHQLQQGNAVDDMNSANDLLMQCENQTGSGEAVAADVRNCTNWVGNNRVWQQRWQDGQ
jgi:hypothetical protein